MPKNNGLSVNGYIPDIKGNRDFLTTYNRHSDSYSVLDLKPEIILVSSRLSMLLMQMDDVDPSLMSHYWAEILTLVEIKRKLIESTTKMGELLFRNKQMERMNDERIKWMGGNKVRMEDLEGIVSEIVNIGQENMSEEKFEIFTKQVALKLSQVEENNSLIGKSK